MLEKIIQFSLKYKLMVILFTITVIGFGIFSIVNIPVGAVPDITNNQVQVITTSTNLSTQEIEQFITSPIELEMANLPGVTEIRSVSKFGLSVVTIVFKESMGTYHGYSSQKRLRLQLPIFLMDLEHPKWVLSQRDLVRYTNIHWM